MKMTRRGFIAALAAVPVIARFLPKPKPQPKGIGLRLMRASDVNSGQVISRLDILCFVPAPPTAPELVEQAYRDINSTIRNHREAMALQREHNHAISGMMDELRLSLPPLSPELVEQAHRDINSMLDRWNREPLDVPIVDVDGTVHRVLIQS